MRKPKSLVGMWRPSRRVAESPQVVVCGEATGDPHAVRQWLTDFATAVRAADYKAGRALFDPGVVSFGTRAAAVIGLDRLVSEQWQQVWERTRGFEFQSGEHIDVRGQFAWVAVTWKSQGWTGGADGRWFDRTGRATFVLSRGGEGWRAVHSHFSMGPPPTPLAKPPKSSRP